MEKDEFITRFKAALKRELPTGSYKGAEDYVNEIAPTYWEDLDQRADGPEECAESEASEWCRGMSVATTAQACRELMAKAALYERGRCIEAICTQCAAGVPVESDGTHILETIQGYPAHVLQCPAQPIRRLTRG